MARFRLTMMASHVMKHRYVALSRLHTFTRTTTAAKRLGFSRHFAAVPQRATKENESDEGLEDSGLNAADSFQRLAEMSRPEWPLIGMSAATLGVTSSITLLFPYASGQVIDYTISSSGDGASPVFLASGLFVLSAVAGGGVYLRSLWLAKAGNRIVARLKQRLFESVIKQESAYLDQHSTGDLLSRLTADAQMVQSALTTQAVAGLRGFVMATGSAGMLFYTSPTLGAVSFCTLPPVFIFTRYVGRKLQKKQQYVQELQGEANTIAEQALSSISTVKQFAGEDYESNKYRNAISKAHKTAVDTAHMQAQLEAGAHVAGNAAVLCVLGYGGTLVLDGSISAGDLTGFVMYSLLMAGNLSGLTSVYSDLNRAVASSNRVFHILDRKPLIASKGMLISARHSEEADPLVSFPFAVEDKSRSQLSASPASIDIKALSFRYPSRPNVNVLNDFCLSVEPGEVVALVGGSGSGKSTVAALLTRLYDSEDANSIRINGKKISDYELRDLREMVGIVSQEPALFQGTIRDNICYGIWGGLSDQRVEEIAELSEVNEFAKKFPNGLETMVGPKGMQLSGGQRQRIALARLFAKDAPICILDEATSNLDARSEHLVQKAMDKLFEERTVVCIAHRLSTIRQSSRVAVLDKGKVVQTGAFEQLASEEGPFRELMKTQLVGDIN